MTTLYTERRVIIVPENKLDSLNHRLCVAMDLTLDDLNTATQASYIDAPAKKKYAVISTSMTLAQADRLEKDSDLPRPGFDRESKVDLTKANEHKLSKIVVGKEPISDHFPLNSMLIVKNRNPHTVIREAGLELISKGRV